MDHPLEDLVLDVQRLFVGSLVEEGQDVSDGRQGQLVDVVSVENVVNESFDLIRQLLHVFNKQNIIIPDNPYSN